MNTFDWAIEFSVHPDERIDVMLAVVEKGLCEALQLRKLRRNKSQRIGRIQVAVQMVDALGEPKVTSHK